MSYLPKAQYLTVAQAIASVLEIPHTGFKPNPNTGLIWAPVGATAHNTGNPSLGLYESYSPETKVAWGDNLNRYYRGMGWHAGPHFVGTPDGVILLGDWLADGVHASCFNEDHFGGETVGNFCVGGDDPKTGKGLASITATASVMAALCVRFGWTASAINFHRQCEHDHHACPGSLVDDAWFLALVTAKIAEIKGIPDAVKAAPAPTAPAVEPAPALALPLSSITTWAPISNPVWVRAAQMINALRAKGAANPLIIATVVNAYRESAITPKVVGDNGSAYGPWQHHWDPRGARILAGCGVDVRSETSIAKLVDALWWELEHVFPKSFAKLNAATAGAEATAIFEREIEGAGAAGALEKRVADAAFLEVWVAQNEAFIAANRVVS